MPIVKHNNRFVENNPREISDSDISRYVQDGWYITHDKVELSPVQNPGEVLPLTESVKSEVVIAVPVVNVEPVKTETLATKPTDQYYARQRGRPRKF